MDIGKRIRNLRKARDLNVSELAQKAFISQSYLSDIETGRTAPSLDKLNIICQTLDISLSEFFGNISVLPSELIHLLESAQKLSKNEVKLLTDFIDALVSRQQR